MYDVSDVLCELTDDFPRDDVLDVWDAVSGGAPLVDAAGLAAIRSRLLAPRTYVTRAEAIEREIVPALGEWVADYDVEGIADALLSYDPMPGAIQLAGFRVRADADFWSVVAAHETAAVTS